MFSIKIFLRLFLQANMRIYIKFILRFYSEVTFQNFAQKTETFKTLSACPKALNIYLSCA